MKKRRNKIKNLCKMVLLLGVFFLSVTLVRGIDINYAAASNGATAEKDLTGYGANYITSNWYDGDVNHGIDGSRSDYYGGGHREDGRCSYITYTVNFFETAPVINTLIIDYIVAQAALVTKRKLELWDGSQWIVVSENDNKLPMTTYYNSNGPNSLIGLDERAIIDGPWYNISKIRIFLHAPCHSKNSEYVAIFNVQAIGPEQECTSGKCCDGFFFRPNTYECGPVDCALVESCTETNTTCPNGTLNFDDFDGTSLSDDWQAILERNVNYYVSGGKLNIENSGDSMWLELQNNNRLYDDFDVEMKFENFQRTTVNGQIELNVLFNDLNFRILRGKACNIPDTGPWTPPYGCVESGTQCNTDYLIVQGPVGSGSGCYNNLLYVEENNELSGTFRIKRVGERLEFYFNGNKVYETTRTDLSDFADVIILSAFAYSGSFSVDIDYFKMNSSGGGENCSQTQTICEYLPEPSCCDIAEYCTGTSVDCPADLFKTAETPCGVCMECNVSGGCISIGSHNYRRGTISNQTDEACCDLATDCVYNNACYKEKMAHQVGTEMRYCSNGEWSIIAELKCDWNHQNCGYCDNNLKCMTPQEQCIDNENFVLDHFCENGKWTSRIKLIALQLLNIAEQTSPDNYTLFCDEYKKTLNYYSYQINNIPITQYLSEANNICVLKLPEQTIFGTSLNEPINQGQFKKTLDLNNCNNAINYNDGKFHQCISGASTVWYNNKTQSIIYSTQDITSSTFDLNFLDAFLTFLKNPFQTIFNSLFNLFKQKPEINQEDYKFINATKEFSRIYLDKKGIKTIKGIAENIPEPEKGEYISVTYQGYTSKICQTLNKLKDKLNDESQLGDNDLFDCRYDTTTSTNYATINSSVRLALWPELTARLRP